MPKLDVTEYKTIEAPFLYMMSPCYGIMVQRNRCGNENEAPRPWHPYYLIHTFIAHGKNTLLDTKSDIGVITNY